jgi:hypothetical protein
MNFKRMRLSDQGKEREEEGNMELKYGMERGKN